MDSNQRVDAAEVGEASETITLLERRSYSPDRQLHKHPFHQIVLPKAGSMDMEVQGKGGRVDGCRGAFVQCGATHVFEAKSASEFVVLDIGVGEMERLPSGAAMVDRIERGAFFPITPQLRHLIGYASAIAIPSIDERVARAWALLMVEDLASMESGGRRLVSGAFVRAIGFIEDHLGEKIAVRDVARRAGMSERRLHRVFKQEVGTTPHAYVMARRAERALDLLTGSSKSLTDVALSTGYADQSALTRHFRKSLDVTPGALRKAAKAPRSS